MRTLLLLLSLAASGFGATDPLAHYDPRGVVSIIIDQAATIGVDYRSAMRRAYAYDDRALADLFRVSTVSDGGGATLHSTYLMTLLSRFGDTRYSALLAHQRPAVRARVIDDLDFAFAARRKNWSREYPITFRSAPHSRRYRAPSRT
jgi:hypothetical protein